MKWVAGIQRALARIEKELDGEIDVRELAREACCSEYNFMRVFSVLSGYSLADYIRCRRLTEAGRELIAAQTKIIDLALKYGYESPESFSRAFQKFHGVSPAQARAGGAMLRSVSPMVLKISIEGGYDMKYRIEKRTAQRFVGFHEWFSGTPAERAEQEERFFKHSRLRQYALMGVSGDCDTQYTLIRNAGEDGYDFCIAVPFGERLPEKQYRDVERLNPEFGELFEQFDVPEATYAVFETEKGRYPTLEQADLRRRAVSEWLPGSGYQLAEGTEMQIIHWYSGGSEKRNERYIELWLPVEAE